MDLLERSLILVGCVLILAVLIGALRAIWTPRFSFARPIDDTSRHAYVVLGVAALAMLLVPLLRSDRLESFEIAGVKATLARLHTDVKSISDQLEDFYKLKRVEIFNSKNWSRVRKVGKWGDGILLEVELEEPPIPGSIDVLEGPIIMPPESYSVAGRHVRFAANSDWPGSYITIRYHSRSNRDRTAVAPGR